MDLIHFLSHFAIILNKLRIYWVDFFTLNLINTFALITKTQFFLSLQMGIVTTII
jgi:hypothetical protein